MKPIAALRTGLNNGVKSRLITGFCIGLYLSLSGGAVAQQASDRGEEPVVIELFTSQGCSSCPPADALLKQLAVRSDVLALALHVDYWDYIGWKDSFGSPSNTNRQKGYAQVGRRKMIYTPQMIIMGEQDVSGADAMAVSEAISSHQATPRPVAIDLLREDGRLTISVSPRVTLPVAPVAIQIIRYTSLETVQIGRGELAGHEIDYANIVNDVQLLEIWDGQQAHEVTIEFEHTEPAAVVVQNSPFGNILAAARIK